MHLAAILVAVFFGLSWLGFVTLFVSTAESAAEALFGVAIMTAFVATICSIMVPGLWGMR